NAAGAKYRFSNEGGNRVGAFARDQLLELIDTVSNEISLAHRRVGAAEVVGCLGMEDAIKRQVELVVEQLQAGERAGNQTRAVVAAPARDDFFLLRPAENVVIVPDQLDVGFVGVGAAQAEIDLR